MSNDTTIKILLVDDRPDNLMSMEIVLENQGYEFYKATSGKDALKILLKEEDFSLILLDVRMPIMDGYETAELIYQREKLRLVPIIFITGQDYEEAAMFKGYQAGAVDYIRKPFSPQILRSKVAVFAELHRKNQLLSKQEEKVRIINEDLMRLNAELEDRVKERTSQLETLNAELKDLNLSKDKFLSVISHDLRNPATALIATSEKLSRDIDKINTKDVKNLSNIIHRTAHKIVQQLNELVDWAKEQREKTKFAPKEINLLSGLNESLELLKVNAIQKQIKLVNKVVNGMYVNADGLMLRSIVQNLVTNAIKYTPQQGTITISAEQLDTMVEICIKDTGVGMSAATMEKLFIESNSSLKGTDNEHGTGLGLLLVKDFVNQHGGVIHVESNEGEGTCFKFTIPAFIQEKLASVSLD
ncbi:MAG: hybrid sensor histidine kinase/response regulator [Pyrinomonadaceae bacterium]|nr:hybrid sensor histidine kinase/response regulator [Sphingobacteriaceae bacterium]